MDSSTLHAALDPTFDEAVLARPARLRDAIVAEWRRNGHADLAHQLRRHPSIVLDRSALLSLAIAEFKTNSATTPSPDIQVYCSRFREFGSAVERSICQQLETVQYLKSCPELFDSCETENWPNPGDQFGDFLVLEEIGAGTTARVYICLQVDLGFRRVVVKATPYSSFEASILGRLDHPNIIPIYSTGCVDNYDLNYLCMPLRGRATLRDVIRLAFGNGCAISGKCIDIAANNGIPKKGVGPFDGRGSLLSRFCRPSYVDRVLGIAIEIADALSAAHCQGILHGDLKPSNILLSPQGHPIVLDFNLSQDCVRSPGICGGTLPYMPPEYLRVVARESELARHSTFNGATDIYSFGALLYELLTGRTPVQPLDANCPPSEVAKTMLSQLKRGVAKVHTYNPTVNRKLDSLVLRCLSLDPANRPASIYEVKYRLQSISRSFSRLRRVVSFSRRLYFDRSKTGSV